LSHSFENHVDLLLYQTENGLRKNCGSPHEVRAQKRHTYFVRVSAIFANQFCLGIVQRFLNNLVFANRLESRLQAENPPAKRGGNTLKRGLYTF
jgi:hypothetical protein